MRNTRGLLFCMLTLLQCAVVSGEGFPLTGEDLVASGAFVCNGAQHQYDWLPNRPYEVRVRMVRIWWGAYKGMTEADLGVVITTLNQPDSGSLIGISSWDHYADPTTLHTDTIKFSPDYISIQPGGGIRFQYSCTAWGASVGKSAALNVSVWYSKHTTP